MVDLALPHTIIIIGQHRNVINGGLEVLLILKILIISIIKLFFSF
jgi:hypothetical protein